MLKKNIEEDLAGIYIGYFDEIISMYLEDASSFAGGNKAKPSNFPSQNVLMEKVKTYLESHKHSINWVCKNIDIVFFLYLYWYLHEFRIFLTIFISILLYF